jgi:NAD(P)-dependent dehydrogenase (short-subunit alcohol dehydrogenase family)
MVSKEFVQNIFSINGKTTIVTGATGALGSAVAWGYGYAGAKVMLTGRNTEKLVALSEAMKKEGIECIYSAGDPAIEADTTRIVNETVKKYGELNILCCCHGYSKPGSILEQATEDWQEMMDANVKGTYLFSKYAAKQMVAQGKGGKMILTSSARSQRGMKGYTGYSTSKAAVDLLAQSLACDLGEHGITVNTFNPTVFRSDLTEWMFHDDNVYQNFLKRIPIGRLGEPEDFVGICIFLASDASNFLTAANIPVDGGYWGN